ncbi:relaxase/mobilization nuclease domain-containing protein [Streptomyces xanthochromogenes]|uniref:relaxase/mobilization nuclease domain-containing protein n=1 Tax=Streptomyces xanthochromogenes TaxID=67384 RepID=UPI003425CCC3
MIPSINESGDRTIGLLYYLYGPGRAEEHVDPHLVASFDGMAPDPGRAADFATAIKNLAHLLDQPVQALPAHARPAKHVWHTSVRTAPDDRTLSEDEWADVARRVVAATGIDPGGGEPGCRWVVVRHADDHIHIVATLVCEDGSRPDDFRSGKRAQAECRLIEEELGLTLVNAGDGTAAKRPTSAERHKAERQGREQTAREKLRETVRRAVAGAASEEEFFDRLAAAGLLIRTRQAPSGDLLGYKVALVDDRNEDNEPVYFAGSTLAPDLSLPRIRERWSAPQLDPAAAAPDDRASTPSGPAQARRRAAAAAWQAILLIGQGSDQQAAALIAASGEVLDALAKTAAAHTRKQLQEAARAFERASRSHVRAERGHDRALREAARDLVYGGPALGRGEDGATTAMVIDMVAFLVIAAAHWHGRKNHAQQAAAARQAAEHLRTAYQSAAQHPIAVLRHRGRRLSQPLQRRQAAHLRQAAPELAEQILAEPGWHALAATLADVEAAGHEPAALLAEAVAHRELDTAGSVSDVLVWRLRRMANLPADASTVPETDTATPQSTGRPKRPSTGRNTRSPRAR